ncbi:MAG: hypothetical protein Sapg2KO_41260 [Saprospiraceae bacterium]
MKKRLLLLSLFGIYIQSLFGQAIDISGLVRDENKQTLIGVTIYNITQDTGYYTDLFGEFYISCHKGDSIQFSYIGYKTRTTKVTVNSAAMEITLEKHKSEYVGGFRYEFQHNIHGLVDDRRDNFIFDYRYSFEHYSKNEIGRKTIHAWTNHIDFGFSHFNQESKSISAYVQVNNFISFLNFKIGPFGFNLLSPYANFGTYHELGNSQVIPRLDFGVYGLQIYHPDFFSLTLDARALRFNGTYSIFYGLVAVKPIIRISGWYP